MDKDKSKKLLAQLLSAFSTEEVEKILSGYHFQDCDWRPYGGREKNWDTVSSQQTSAVGALTELVINSIDAVLSRKAYEHGIKDLSSDEAPKSMQDAVRKFYGVNEGKLSSLETKQLTELAKKSILIGIKRKRKKSTTPTITVVDFGEGQEPGNFEGTFLSLSEINKEGVGFVQGKFNMGSTGSIPFCTESDITKGHYKLIASKRHDSNLWGWTLIRVSQVEEGRKLPIVKYLKPDDKIPAFESESIKAFGHDRIGVIEQGSVVKLFDYDVGSGPHQVDLGLYEALMLNLLDCALPVRLYDFDAQRVEGKGELRDEGIIDRTFSGMNVMLHADIVDISSQDPSIKNKKPDGQITEFVHLVTESRDEELGRVRIVATGISKLPSFLERSKKRIFYTINGQTHATENASFLNKKDVGLGDLQNHIIVNIQCEAMDKTALNAIFSGNREQKKDIRLGRNLETWVKKSLKEDAKLKEYQNIIRMRRAAEIIKDDQETKKLLGDLIIQDPAIRQLLGIGGNVLAPTTGPGGYQPWNEGKQFPTFLNPLSVGKNSDNRVIKQLPVNTYRQIKCDTDAANDYLTRDNSPGRIYISNNSINVSVSVKLHNGKATFTFAPPSKTKVAIGDQISFDVGFEDYGPRGGPLSFPLTLEFVKAEDTQKNPSSEPTDTKEKIKESVADPTEWVNKENWNEFDFNEKSGAAVRVAGDEIKIHVNRHHTILERMRGEESDKARLELNENRFRICLGFLTLAIYRHHNDDDDGDATEKAKKSSDAIAPYILSLITTLGEGKQL